LPNQRDHAQRFFKNVALLAHADQFGLQRAVFGGQIGAGRGGVAHISALPIFEAGIADAQFGRNLGAPLATFDPVLHSLAFKDFVVTLDRQGRLWGIEGGGLGFRWLGLFIAVRFVAHRPNVSIKPG